MTMRALFLSTAGAAALATLAFTAQGRASEVDAPPVLAPVGLERAVSPQTYLTLLASSDTGEINQALAEIEAAYTPALATQLVEVAILSGTSRAERGVIDILERRTGETFGGDYRAWFKWIWAQPEAITADYAEFKADLYSIIDPRFAGYFSNRQDTARIRLDEIRWGGVVQDGIPPLRGPDMIAAADADYLADDNIVFGIEINGDARAYPKRILAWHEMFVDEVGGEKIAGVYCTLCGTVIPYKTEVNGVNHELGTSGFLYRSNKLMYDAATQSLWNTIKGEPVVGPLVDRGIKLEHLSVVTTTWGEWKRRHPDTQVLSLETGHRRDYGEGVAYQDYFATDQLMFQTPFDDTRLKNKQEVVALRFAASPGQQLAIDTAFLEDNPIYADRIGAQKLVVLTDASGANRVYDPKEVEFVDYDRDSTLTDAEGVTWTLDEQLLTAEDGRTLERLPYHRAFWFGWHATFPETRLVK
ncbi:MAG: DUF3179 domain-containing protein [Pseudomonadota bacterium]